jgi:hypothetical protein
MAGGAACSRRDDRWTGVHHARLCGSRKLRQCGLQRRAVDNGYRQGLDEGRNDARHHRSFSPERHSAYRDAQRNYGGGWERDAYQRGFRRGFESGYRDGFDRYARDDRRDWR